MQVVLAVIIIVSSLIPASVRGHGSGPPYLLVNGVYAQTNPIQGISPDRLALDTLTETFVVGEPIAFEIDMKNLGFPAEIRWKWSRDDTSYQKGASVTHTYDKPGSYLVSIQAKGEPTSGEFADYNSVQINVAPKDAYKPPQIKLRSSVTDGGKVWNVSYDAVVATDPTAEIVKYEWRLGDGTRAEGQSIQHTYKKGFYQAFPLLFVTDNNGIEAAISFQIDEVGNKFTVNELPFFPNTIETSRKNNTPTFLYILFPVLVGFGLIAFLVIKRQRTKKL